MTRKTRTPSPRKQPAKKQPTKTEGYETQIEDLQSQLIGRLATLNSSAKSCLELLREGVLSNSATQKTSELLSSELLEMAIHTMSMCVLAKEWMCISGVFPLTSSDPTALAGLLDGRVLVPDEMTWHFDD